MTAPLTIMSFFEANSFTTTLNNILSLQKPLGLCIYAVLIVLFTFFYTNLQVDPEKIAENLGKSGTYIPGIRPGTETKEYLSKVLNRITVLGAIFLVFIALCAADGDKPAVLGFNGRNRNHHRRRRCHGNDEPAERSADPEIISRFYSKIRGE